MEALILIFGALTLWAGLEILLKPVRICGFLSKHSDQVVLHVLNVVVRIVFGISILSLSGISNFPLLTDTIGWFCIGIALMLTLMGRTRFKRSISWAIALVKTNSLIAGFLIIAFGTFLICAFI